MKIFIDAGYYIGKAMEYYAPFLDNTWTVYAFEPNTNMDVEESIKRFPFNVEWIKKALWTEDGEKEFVLTGRNDASHLSSVRTSTDEKVTVPVINFSKFIADLPDDATICISMDIEGAEYPVLRKMIEDKTISKVDLLDIEFHHRLLPNETDSTSSDLRQTIERLGVLVKLKLEI